MSHEAVGLAVPLMIFASAACTPGEAVLVHVAVVDATTDGVVVGEEPEEGVAGMGGMVCTFDTDDGSIGDEWSLDSGVREKVQDIDDADGRIVAVAADGVHLLTDPFDPAPTLRWPGSRIQAARLASDGLFGLDERAKVGCVAAWRTEAGEMSHVSLEQAVCADLSDLAYDRVDDVAFLATPEALLRVDRLGATELGGPTRAVAHDPGRALYAADHDGFVRAFEESGSELWSVALTGEVVAMAPMGALASVVVAQDLGGQGGRLTVLRGADGSVLDQVDVPVAGKDVVTGAFGEMTVLVLEHELHVFELDEEAAEQAARGG